MFKGGAGGAVDSVVPQLLEGMRKVLLYMCCYAHMSYAGGTVGSVVLQLLEAVNAQGLLVFLYLSMHSIGEVVNAWCPICRPGRASEVWQVLGGPAPHPWVCGHMLSQWRAAKAHYITWVKLNSSMMTCDVHAPPLLSKSSRAKREWWIEVWGAHPERKVSAYTLALLPHALPGAMLGPP
eukprot:scaffold21793_cov23-Tisochrysis_lutea.AAC.2